MVFIDTVLQYHLAVPFPEDLPDEIWAQKYAILLDILKAEKQTS